MTANLEGREVLILGRASVVHDRITGCIHNGPLSIGADRPLGVVRIGRSPLSGDARHPCLVFRYRSTLALTTTDLTEAHTLEDEVGVGDASLGMGTPERLEESLDAIHEGLRLAPDLECASDVVAEHLGDSLLHLNLRVAAGVHPLRSLQVGVSTLHGLAVLELHVTLPCGKVAEALPLCVREQAKAA